MCLGNGKHVGKHGHFGIAAPILKDRCIAGLCKGSKVNDSPLKLLESGMRGYLVCKVTSNL